MEQAPHDAPAAQPHASATSQRSIVCALLLSAAIFVLLALILAYAANAEKQHLIDSTLARLAHRSHVVAIETNRAFLSTRQVLIGVRDTISALENDGNATRQEIISLLKRRKENLPYLLDMMVLDKRGHITHWTQTGSPPYVQDRDYASAHLTHGHKGLFVGTPLKSRVSGRRFIGTSIAMRAPGGNIENIIVAIVSIKALEDTFADMVIPDGQSIGILGQDGKTVFSLPETQASTSMLLEHQNITAHHRIPESPFVVESPLDGNDRFVAVTELRDAPLVAFAVQPTSSVDAPLYASLTPYIILGICAALLVLTSCVWHVRSAAVFARCAGSLSDMSTKDQLTHVYNRPTFMDFAQREYNRAVRYGTPLSCIIFDIDDFSKVNTQHGHGTGDALLKQLASSIARNSRKTDTVARLSGNEFGILLPGTPLDGAYASAEQHRERTETTAFKCAGVELGATISIGVAELADEDSTAQALLDRTHAAMLSAKKRGGNTIATAD